MVFSRAKFIKTRTPFDPNRLNESTNFAPMYATTFNIDTLPTSAVLNYCALGTGYVYINGRAVSEDLFPCPASDYKSTLWYVSYDVAPLLHKGENLIVALVGNGFFNEDMWNIWESHLASYRDHPKIILELLLDGEVALATDGDWKYSDNSPYTMNRLRVGTDYDARITPPDSPSLDISEWDRAMIDDRAPSGVFRPVECEPIREIESYAPVSTERVADGVYVFDFGLNSSGYVRIRTRQRRGDKLVIRYSEELPFDCPSYTDVTCSFYKGSRPFYETLICSGEELEWSTKLAYYGFRYVEISGLDPDALISVEAVYVHQAVARRSSFNSSDPLINKLFELGIRATESNMFYMPTDCPTREKYGWMNDAQSSAEQILTDFHAERMLSRWLQDIRDSFDPTYGFPGIVPTHGWSYMPKPGRRRYNGPVSDGSFFEQAHRIYLHSGDKQPLVDNLPLFRKYFEMLANNLDNDGFVNYGLHDWANPNDNREVTPTALVNGLLCIKFADIAILASELAGEDASYFKAERARTEACLYKKFVNSDGTCAVDGQTAVAMCIYFGIGDKEALAAQLKRLVEEKDFHHDCGMVGIRYLYMALNACGLQEYAYRILTAKGYPSYSAWVDDGATALYEYWSFKGSKNHHMYSDFMSWMIKTILGISPDDNAPSFERVEVSPYFLEALDFAEGHYDAPFGRVEVRWERCDSQISLAITAPKDSTVYYKGKALPEGTTTVKI